MMHFKSIKRILPLLMLLFLLAAYVQIPVLAEDTEVTGDDIYVLNRDGNGESLYLYQSPCMLGYDLNNKYGGNGVPIQAFIYTMYNSVTDEHFPTYCSDINVTAVQGSDYRRMNLEDSPFSGSAAGRVRAILEEGFYIIPVEGESYDAHAARVAEKTAALATAAGADGLTTGEAIAATQAALWQVIHGPELSFPNFCRYVFNPTNTKYQSLCSYSELRSKNLALVRTTIQTVYDYLLSLDPVAATEKTVSASAFTDLNDPVLTENADGTYNISVTTTVDVKLVEGDVLTLKAVIDGTYTASTALTDGTQTVTLTLENVPASVASNEVKLSVSGYQTSEGYFFFDAVGARGESQSMVGYNNSRLPVYAEVVAAEERVLNINKHTKAKVGAGNYVTMPLSNITFDIHFVATMDDYLSGAVTLPEATEYVYPTLAEYSVTTDASGKAWFSFSHNGLSDGVYLVVERSHPSIVAPIDPFYLYVPQADASSGEPVYEITIKPKNDVKGGVYIDKDVISIGNDQATVNAYEPHTWIIGTTIPEDISAGKSYVITDTLDNRLDFLGSVAVVLDDSGENGENLGLSADTDYTLTVTDVDSLAEGKPSDAFEIALTASGMSKIATAVGDNSYGDYMLRVYFNAQINANAVMGTEIPNYAEVAYVNDVNFEFTQKSDEPYVYTGGINLLKVDSENASKTLSGAIFEVYRTATADEVAAGGDRLTTIDGVVEKVVKVSFFDNAALTGDKVTYVTSDEKGKAAIYGLAFGKYYLVETVAPAGYNTLGETFELTIDSASHTAEKTITVKNVGGTVLPVTGGIGTTIYTVSGITLLGIALIMIIIKRRKAANAE